jgi:New glue family protein
MGAAGRLLVIAAAVATAVVLFVVLRDGNGESGPTTSTEPTTSESTTETQTGPTATDSTTSPTTTTQPEPQRRRIRLTIPAGGPEGIRRIEVEQGERIVLLIRSGVTDHAHLHGYDLMAHVGPGTVARIRFRADIPGRFELELEERGQQFAELTVAP